MNKQLQTLLHDSLAYYRARQLKKALNTAQIALEFGLNEGAEKPGLISAYLLLARIYHTNGIYQNEPAYFQKALQAVREAELINTTTEDDKLAVEIAEVEGIVLLSMQEPEQAESALKTSLALARQLKDPLAEAKSLASICHFHLEKKEVEAAVSSALEALKVLQTTAPTTHKSVATEVYLQLSQAHIKRQEYSQSLEMSQHLLELSRSIGDVEKEVIALRNIAVVCGVKSNFKIGMQYFLEALDKCEAIGYRELGVQIQINIGTLYAQLYNHEEAISRYQSVLDKDADLLDDKTKVVIFNNLGNIYLSNGQYELALGYFEKARQKAESDNYLEMVAHSLAQSGRTKISMGQLGAAKKDALAASKIFEKLGEVNGKQINLLNLGALAYEEQDFENAVELTKQGIEAAKRFKDDTSEIKGYKLLSSIYKATKQFEKSLKYQERYAKIQEEYANVQRQRQFLDMEIRHAIREKQKEIEQLTKENEYQALLLQKSDKIARQNQELLQANEELRQFAYIASHDLKEPLRMIGSYTQLIERIIFNHLDEKGRQYFNFVTDGVQRMNNLLDGLLKYATIGKQEIEKEEVNLNDIIHLSLANLKFRVIEKNAEIICKELPVVKGNAQLLTQLFQNLIGNALKFVKPETQPSVVIAAYEIEQEHIIAFKDNGIGISPEHQERIFEIFHRLHPRTAYEGTGIGLAICHKIVKLMGGRIWVESEEGEGSTFYIALPK